MLKKGYLLIIPKNPKSKIIIFKNIIYKTFYI